MKNKVAAYVASGGDADSALNFAKAISEASGVANTHVKLGSIQGEMPKPSISIPKLKDLHEFIFKDDDKILARRIPGVGSGTVLDLKNGVKDICTEYVYELINAKEMVDGKPSRKTRKLDSRKAKVVLEDDLAYEEEESTFKTEAEILYTCDKNEHCSLSYLKFENYVKHVTTDAQCKIQVPTESNKDKVLSWYAADFGLPDKTDLLETEEGKHLILQLQKSPDIFFNDDLPRRDTEHSKVNPGSNEEMPMGDGLPKARKNVRHAKDVHAFAQELFEIGLQNKRKVRACEAVELMYNAKNSDGSQRFLCSQWLDEGQVSLSWIIK